MPVLVAEPMGVWGELLVLVPEPMGVWGNCWFSWLNLWMMGDRFSCLDPEGGTRERNQREVFRWGVNESIGVIMAEIISIVGGV